MRINRVISGIAIAALLALGFAVSFSYRPVQTERTATEKTGVSQRCSQIYDPVCGRDGKTYANECTADQQGVPLLYRGTCAVPSELSQDERRYLFWLLRAREAAGLATASVRHVTTTNGSCPSCREYYYSWDDPAVYARVTATDATVTAALDSTGYEYLEQRQGTPVSFGNIVSEE